jgi:hypothetical protein
MRRVLVTIIAAAALAACGGEEEEPTPETAAAPETPQAVDAWCAARVDEITAAETEAIRSRAVRQVERFEAMIDRAETAAGTGLGDVYALAGEEVEKMFAAEGLMLTLPLPAEVEALAGRIAGLPEGSGARRAGDDLLEARRTLERVDAAIRAGEPGDGGKTLDEVAATLARLDAARAASGIGSCLDLLAEPDEVRVVAAMAASAVAGAPGGDAPVLAEAIADAEPWLDVSALTDRCAVPGDPDDPGSESGFTAGVWTQAQAVEITVSNGIRVGTLALRPDGETWMLDDVDFSDGVDRRAGPCPA